MITPSNIAAFPNEILGRIARFASLPSDDFDWNQTEWKDSHKTLTRLASCNRTLAAFCRPLAWEKMLSSSEDYYESLLAHLYRTSSVHSLVKDLSWAETYSFSRMSVFTLPLLQNLAAFSWTPSDGGEYVVPKAITDIFPRLRHLRRYQLTYCNGFEDSALCLGAVLPHLRDLRLDECYMSPILLNQRLGRLERLEATYTFMQETTLTASDAATSLATLRQLDLCPEDGTDDSDIEFCTSKIQDLLRQNPTLVSPLRVCSLTLHRLFTSPTPIIDLLRALEDLRKVTLRQQEVVKSPVAEPWSRLRLPQVQELVLEGYPPFRDDEPIEPLPFAAILSSFPNTTRLEIVNVLYLKSAKTTMYRPGWTTEGPLQQLLDAAKDSANMSEVIIRGSIDRKVSLHCTRDDSMVDGFVRELYHSEG